MKNQIWSLMVKRKAFTARNIVNDLMETKYKYLGKTFIKNKVKDFIKQQLYKASIIAVEEGVFVIKPYEKEWDKFIEKRKCVICNKEFIPLEDKQMFCSKNCKKEYYKLYHQARRHSKKTNRNFQKWQDWEDKKLLETFKTKTGTYRFSRAKAEDLAKELGRSTDAIKERLKILRRRQKGVAL